MQSAAPLDDPSVVVLMGVSGSGKSTIAAMLAHRLHWIYEDGDWFHPRSNIEKMHSGLPLTDEDRWPWLEAIAAWIDATRKAGNHGVVACSALVYWRDRSDPFLFLDLGERTNVALEAWGARRCARARTAIERAITMDRTNRSLQELRADIEQQCK